MQETKRIKKVARKQVRAIVEAQPGSSSGAGQEQNRDDVWEQF